MTWHIHIQGQVQGIGFRPFVYLLAQKFRLCGWVNNTVDGLHIEFNADTYLAGQFKNSLLQNAPTLSCITAARMFEVEEKCFEDFQIVHSENEGKRNLLITPDFAMCKTCKSELNKEDNIRFHYPFTTCVNCGPRFSIITELPYDREHSSMKDFAMCASCHSEYNDPQNRRYYSQTNSCPNCRIELTLFDADKNKISDETEEILELITRFWSQGKIVAIKGIGGYLLTCDARSGDAILTLRERKHRPSKPFALMYRSIEDLSEFDVSEQELEALESPVSPIVLMNLLDHSTVNPEVAPGLGQVGVMIPYAPIYELLLSRYKQPIVATSGNVTNSPIVFKDDIALQDLPAVADYILSNNREIIIPQDDSVVRYTYWGKQRILYRRSRGMAPTYVGKDLVSSDETILAMGAMLKSTFCLFHNGNSFISQYLGDLQHFDTQQVYKESIAHFLNLFQANAEVILCDLHEDYPSTIYGNDLAQKLKIQIYPIQHHIAHFGAVLGEHHLLDKKEPVLGVVWDGTGLGDDGQIWGGEFFKFENYEFLRCYHFDYFDFILGDKMPKEPRISALSACWDVMGAEKFLEDKFTKTEWQIYSKLLSKENPLKTSSVGRIFDAVASLLCLADKQSYEGEAAMRLEKLATDYFKVNGLEFPESYFMEGAHYYRIPTKSLMGNIMIDLHKGKSKAFIAAKFHFSLMKIISIVASHINVSKIAFSGGVFQNGLLVDLINHHLSNEFELLFHKDLSPNDENISFGQQIYYQITKRKESLKIIKSKNHVFSNSR